METKEWIELFVPIVSNLLISGFIVVYLKNLVDRKFNKASKRDQYFIVVMSNLNTHIAELKNHIIMLQTKQITDNASGIEKIFLLGGDIQLYIKDFSCYMDNCKRTYHKDVFETEMLDMLLSELTECGKAMKMSSESDTYVAIFSEKVNSVLALCQEIVQKYITVLSDK